MSEKEITRSEAIKAGKKRYFTGKPCNRGHVAERYCSGKQCVQCAAEDGKRRYKENPEKYCAQGREWAKNNKERQREIGRRAERNNTHTRKKWREANREKRRSYYRKWYGNNRAYNNARLAQYRAAKKNATTQWASQEEMQYVYQLARDRGLVVDHIVPLESEFVCGLHTPDNLRCIPETLNKKKGSHYWPDMP